MEYLIRRFRVNELNVDALLRAALPYHDTKVRRSCFAFACDLGLRLILLLLQQMFARLVQISSIEHTIWFWLEGVKKSGSPIPRHALASRCTSDSALLTSVLTLVRELAATAADRSASTVQRIEQLVSFYAAVVIEALSMAKSTNEEFVRALYPFIISFLTGSYVSGEPDADMDAPTHRQLLTATCMVVTQLVRVTRLSSDVLSSLISALCGQNDFSPEVVCTLLAISQHQRVKHIPKKALRSLIGQVDDFLSAVQAQAAKYDVGRFTTLFTGSVAGVLSSEASVSKNSAALHALHQIFRILPCGGEVRPALRSLLGFLVTVPAGDDKEALLDAASKVFDAISSKYPRQLDEAVAAISSAATTSGDDAAEDRASKGSGKRSRNDYSTSASSAADVEAMLEVLRQIFTGTRSVFVPLAEGKPRTCKFRGVSGKH
jgi:U3 small nucleolar RNA-associated protein 10